MFGGLLFGLGFGLVFLFKRAREEVLYRIYVLRERPEKIRPEVDSGELVRSVVWELLPSLLLSVLVVGLLIGLVWELLTRWPFKDSAVSSRQTPVWPSTKRQLLNFLRRAGRGLLLGLLLGLFSGLLGLLSGLEDELYFGLEFGLVLALYSGLGFGLVLALGFGLLETQSVLITSHTLKETHSRSLNTALTWLGSGLVVGQFLGLVSRLYFAPFFGLFLSLVVGPCFRLFLGLSNGGWFVLLQKVAHRRLAKAGNLPPRPYDFLEWGIERQVFRRVGGGVRFRHNLIQQHLAKVSEGTNEG